MLRTLVREKKQPESVEILSEECDRGIIANNKKTTKTKEVTRHPRLTCKEKQRDHQSTLVMLNATFSQTPTVP